MPMHWYGDRVQRQVQRGLNRNMHAACRFLVNDIKRKFPDPRVSTESGVPKPRSQPGEIPHVDIGNLRRAINYLIKGTLRRVGRLHGFVGVLKEKKEDPSTATALGYAAYLETGTSKMGARPYLRPAIDRNRAKVARLLGKYIR